MSAASTPPPVTLSRFGTPCDALDAGLVPERPTRDVRGLYLTDREKWLTRHLGRDMGPEVEWTRADLDAGVPGWPVKVEGCGWYATYAAISGYCGIEPLSREQLAARERERLMAEMGHALVEQLDDRHVLYSTPRSHRGERSAMAHTLAWLS